MTNDATTPPPAHGESRPAPATDREPLVDGRRQRSLTSQRRIVEAMLALVGEGHLTPSAELVAERAEVGLRTVFRQFKDMDTLIGRKLGFAGGAMDDHILNAEAAEGF